MAYFLFPFKRVAATHPPLVRYEVVARTTTPFSLSRIYLGEVGGGIETLVADIRKEADTEFWQAARAGGMRVAQGEMYNLQLMQVSANNALKVRWALNKTSDLFITEYAEGMTVDEFDEAEYEQFAELLTQMLKQGPIAA